jgi:SulP family sulfate permease
VTELKSKPERLATHSNHGDLRGDFWGGLAAMLVAMPSAIAFGVTIYTPLGGSYAAYGALAGILGATALGLVAAATGGTKRLITAPCAPAAAVMAALAIGLMRKGVPIASALLMLSAVGLLAGLFQVLFGLVGLGRLIKYMPYPVVSGYMSGVGLIILTSQIPILLGAHTGTHFWPALSGIAMWKWQTIAVGFVTVAVMVGAPRLTNAVPATILGLAAGVIAYGGFAWADPALRVLADNSQVIGPLGGSGPGLLSAFSGRLTAIRAMGLADLPALLIPALTLAVLLSIDTLKTCVVLDTVTRSRHDSNRELLGQGLGNLTSAAIGGMPGAGQMGATLVNISSGGNSRRSGLIEGALSLLAFLALGALIAWVPVAALAGILVVVGVRMIDLHSLHFLKARSTIFDFVVIVAVVVTAQTVSLIAASGVGVVLAIVLFIREQIGGSVVHRKTNGNKIFSRQTRLPAAMAILQRDGGQAVIFELQGSLFFGTADKLYSALEPELKTRRYVILDLRRVQSVDVTAAHLLEQVEDILAERGGFLLFSHIPPRLPSGQDVQRYFDEVGLVRAESRARIFAELDNALEWVEERILAEAEFTKSEEQPLELHEIDLFKGRKAETFRALEACMEKRACKSGEKIFGRGDTDDVLYLIRRGAVRIMLQLDETQWRHVGTFGRGNFFGEMAFLDGQVRSADAITLTDTELFALSRKQFDALAEEHKRMAINLLEGLARVLAIRLRDANAELHVLQT